VSERKSRVLQESVNPISWFCGFREKYNLSARRRKRFVASNHGRETVKRSLQCDRGKAVKKSYWLPPGCLNVLSFEASIQNRQMVYLKCESAVVYKSER